MIHYNHSINSDATDSRICGRVGFKVCMASNSFQKNEKHVPWQVTVSSEICSSLGENEHAQGVSQ